MFFSLTIARTVFSNTLLHCPVVTPKLNSATAGVTAFSATQSRPAMVSLIVPGRQKECECSAYIQAPVQPSYTQDSMCLRLHTRLCKSDSKTVITELTLKRLSSAAENLLFYAPQPNSDVWLGHPFSPEKLGRPRPGKLQGEPPITFHCLPHDITQTSRCIPEAGATLG
jgi:hypothetical protein